MNIFKDPKEKHDWYVYSTTLNEGWLMLYCKKTGKYGVVEDPTREEWSKAFQAPKNPYKWNEPTRVRITH